MANAFTDNQFVEKSVIGLLAEPSWISVPTLEERVLLLPRMLSWQVNFLITKT